MEAKLNTEHTDWEQFPYLDSADVIAVQRGPEPGGIGAVARVFGATLKGLRTTMARVIVSAQSTKVRTCFGSRDRDRSRMRTRLRMPFRPPRASVGCATSGAG